MRIDTHSLRLILGLFLLMVTSINTSGTCFAQGVEDASEAKIRDDLAEAVDKYNQVIETAEEALRLALSAECDKIRSSLSTEERIHQKTLLEAEFNAFKERQTEPTNRVLRRASEVYSDSLQSAAERCYEAHTAAAEAFDRLGRLEDAAAVLEGRHELFVASPYWLPPIPLFVDVNVEALLRHRPKFTKGFEKEFKSIVRASKGKDRLRFRREVDAAIEAVMASQKAAEPAGNPNCREDIKHVLGAIKSGKWDLRDVKVHYRDHRMRKMHDGLPGLKYR